MSVLTAYPQILAAGAELGSRSDFPAADFSDNHHYANPQCGTPFYSIQSTPFDPSRIAIQGEFGGLGENTTIDQ